LLRSATCSRPSSRRNESKGITLAILIAALLAAGRLGAQEARLEISLQSNMVHVAIEFESPRSEEVLASLRDGLKAEIIFQARLYRKSRGLLSFLGDRLLVETKISRTAYFDFYENRYMILRDGNLLGKYAGEQEFLRSFFFLPDLELGQIDISELPKLYVLARVRLMPVKIVSPLNIITLFSSETVSTSPWLEAEIRPPGGREPAESNARR
jgi:hypothetical protein